MLNPSLLRHGLSTLALKLEIDLFASKLNKQFSKYCSYTPNPSALHVNAFTIPWNSLKFYCFPPFSCILQVLQKIIMEKAEGVIVFPNWPTQAWYPILKQLLIKPSTMLPPSKQMLLVPAVPDQLHPLHQNLELKISCVWSNRNFRAIPICSQCDYVFMEEGYQTPVSNILLKMD